MSESLSNDVALSVASIPNVKSALVLLVMRDHRIDLAVRGSQPAPDIHKMLMGIRDLVMDFGHEHADRIEVDVMKVGGEDIGRDEAEAAGYGTGSTPTDLETLQRETREAMKAEMMKANDLIHRLFNGQVKPDEPIDARTMTLAGVLIAVSGAQRSGLGFDGLGVLCSEMWEPAGEAIKTINARKAGA